jgi:DNA-binding NtrC family response regulator
VAVILCLDDDPRANAILATFLEEMGHSALPVGSVPAVLAALESEPVDLLITDYAMPGMTGLDVLRLLREERYDIPVIVLTAYASVEQAVGAIKLGAVNYLAKPVSYNALEAAVHQALELQSLKREVHALRAEVAKPGATRPIVGTSSSIRRLLRTATAVAPSRASVLITGESGTGKELVARTIHDSSDRHTGPYVRINCAAIPEGLIESALFGHEKGAFTGAIRQTDGAFERANGGTLLLDEISEMRLDLQAKLLRVLQEMEFERVGGTRTIQVDVRVVATTNRELPAEIAAGRFRQDLYYRLNTVTLHVPPLRERPDDIPPLAMHFLLRSASSMNKTVEGFTRDALHQLQARPWLGNVRELQHTVERAVILVTGPMITSDLLDPTATPSQSLPAQRDTISPVVYFDSYELAAAESLLIERALLAANGNRSTAARLLGIHVRTLRRKLNEPARDESVRDDATSQGAMA